MGAYSLPLASLAEDNRATEWPTVSDASGMRIAITASNEVADALVLAVNHHDALVEALEPVGKLELWTESAADDELVIMTVGTIRRMRAALAAVRGQK